MSKQAAAKARDETGVEQKNREIESYRGFCQASGLSWPR